MRKVVSVSLGYNRGGRHIEREEERERLMESHRGREREHNKKTMIIE